MTLTITALLKLEALLLNPHGISQAPDPVFPFVRHDRLLLMAAAAELLLAGAFLFRLPAMVSFGALLLLSAGFAGYGWVQDALVSSASCGCLGARWENPSAEQAARVVVLGVMSVTGGLGFLAGCINRWSAESETKQ
ncbi:MAG: hypothetical protein D6766_02860 [Verrucomicrobia bacterium]|nr:MAG: hypothetical protein D6766_02860 [Verrucomicrobiota bacterium]